MIYDNSTLFEEASFEIAQIGLCRVPEPSKEDFRMLNDFPSVCELDPNEVIEKKCTREDPFDNIFGSSLLQDKVFEEESISNKNQFSLSTQELLDDMEPKVTQKSSQAEEVKQEESNKKETTQKKSPKKRSKRPKITQKVKSFDNRTRFCKKHDRGKLLYQSHIFGIKDFYPI